MTGQLQETTGASAQYRGAISQPLDRLCEMAAEALGVQSAAIVLQVGAVSRVIASTGLAPRFRSRFWQAEELPYAPDETVTLPDAATRPALGSKLALIGLGATGFFLRTPVTVDPAYVLGLILADPSKSRKPTARQLTLLDEIKGLIRDAFSTHAALLTDPEADVTAAITLAEAVAETNAAPHAAALLDQRLTILAASPAMADILEVPRDRLIGMTHAEVAVPMSDAIGALYRRALETRVSPPDFEVVTEEGEAGRAVYRTTVSPFSPIETRDYFLSVTTREVTEINAREEALARRIGHAAPLPEPSLAFLTETLVERRTIRSRKAISYLTLRAWRSPIREWQIKALKALKANIPPAMPEAIGDEILAEINALVGTAAFRAVVPIPCGHTREGPCLSLEMARTLAGKIGIPVVQAFVTQPTKGTSHPKENTRRPPLVLAVPVQEPVLLIDDVATSGAHIEEAVRLLKPHTGSVLAVAWIGGDSV